MRIIEKPLTFEDFKVVRGNQDTRTANRIIGALNEKIRCGETKIKSWASDPEPDSVIHIVSETFRLAGWRGVVQVKRPGRAYAVELVLPECKEGKT